MLSTCWRHPERSLAVYGQTQSKDLYLSSGTNSGPATQAGAPGPRFWDLGFPCEPNFRAPSSRLFSVARVGNHRSRTKRCRVPQVSILRPGRKAPATHESSPRNKGEQHSHPVMIGRPPTDRTKQPQIGRPRQSQLPNIRNASPPDRTIPKCPEQSGTGKAIYAKVGI
jgi:hypothetical protein